PALELVPVLPAAAGLERVRVLDAPPGQLSTRLRDLLVPLRLLGLELRELVPGHLPFFTASDPVLGHFISLRVRTPALPHEPIPSSQRAGITNETAEHPRTHRKAHRLRDMVLAHRLMALVRPRRVARDFRR